MFLTQSPISSWLFYLAIIIVQNTITLSENVAGDQQVEGRERNATQHQNHWIPLVGNHSRVEHLRYNGRTRQEHEWIMEKVKTLKNLSSRLRLGRDLLPDELDSTTASYGDVILTREQVLRLERILLQAQAAPQSGKRTKRQVMEVYSDLTNKWTFPILYVIDPILNGTYPQVIDKAIRNWMRETCVVFQKVPPTQVVTQQHILYTDNDSGCSSYVGRTNVADGYLIPQTINLQRPNCLNFVGTAAHETGHALGLYHEMVRPDRDTYLDILWQNILPGESLQFEPPTHSVVLTDGQPYDYGSVMQYAAMAFANQTGQYSMLPVDLTHRTTMGQATEISFYDAKLINTAYCSDVCNATLPCLNDGYTDPKNCSKCRCPDGFGGTLCNELAQGSSGCSPLSRFIAVSVSKTVVDPENSATFQCLQSPNFTSSNPRFGSQGFGSYKEGDNCTWRLQAPTGCALRLWFNTDWYGLLLSVLGACEHWVEIKHKTTHLTRGERFCGYNSPTYNASFPLVTEVNDVTIIFKSPPEDGANDPLPWYYFQGFQLCYAINDNKCAQTATSTTVVTTTKQTTHAATSQAHSTHAATSQAHSTHAATSQAHSTRVATSQAHSTRAATSQTHSTRAATSQAHTTYAATSQAHSTRAATIQAHSTHAAASQEHSTRVATSQAHSTRVATSQAHSTHAATSQAHSTHAATIQAHSTLSSSSTRSFTRSATSAPTTHRPTDKILPTASPTPTPPSTSIVPTTPLPKSTGSTLKKTTTSFMTGSSTTGHRQTTTVTPEPCSSSLIEQLALWRQSRSYPFPAPNGVGDISYSVIVTVSDSNMTRLTNDSYYQNVMQNIACQVTIILYTVYELNFLQPKTDYRVNCPAGANKRCRLILTMTIALNSTTTSMPNVQAITRYIDNVLTKVGQFSFSLVQISWFRRNLASG